MCYTSHILLRSGPRPVVFMAKKHSESNFIMSLSPQSDQQSLMYVPPVCISPSHQLVVCLGVSLYTKAHHVVWTQMVFLTSPLLMFFKSQDPPYTSQYTPHAKLAALAWILINKVLLLVVGTTYLPTCYDYPFYTWSPGEIVVGMSSTSCVELAVIKPVSANIVMVDGQYVPPSLYQGDRRANASLLGVGPACHILGNSS